MQDFELCEDLHYDRFLCGELSSLGEHRLQVFFHLADRGLSALAEITHQSAEYFFKDELLLYHEDALGEHDGSFDSLNHHWLRQSISDTCHQCLQSLLVGLLVVVLSILEAVDKFVDDLHEYLFVLGLADIVEAASDKKECHVKHSIICLDNLALLCFQVFLVSIWHCH